MNCRICGEEFTGAYVKLKGICYGTKGTWDYFRCRSCGCLQIREIPVDLETYYDSDTYYSLNTANRGFRIRMWNHLFRYQVTGKDFLGKMIEMVFPSNYKFMRTVSREASILDIGCGDGQRLRQLQWIGFKNLYGLEPNIKEEIVCQDNDSQITIYKGSLDEDCFFPERKFDYVIFEHSFEHICDEHKTLERTKKLLNPGGTLVLKLPQLSEYYWRRFGINQTVLDPPRHIYIHTHESMQRLIQAHGMKIVGYSSETEPVEYIAAERAKKGKTTDITHIPFFRLLFCGIVTYPQRHRLDKRRDGACATFVIKTASANDEKYKG